jgi:periplasmic copper chaperone A
MLGTFFPPRTRHGQARQRVPATARSAAVACVAAALAAALGGCAARASAASPPIQVGTAYVALPSPAGTTDAYVVISNHGPADRLISARSSAGGQVRLGGPVGRGAATMRIVGDISIPAGALVRFTPDGFHLVITGSGPMRAGTEITLTLVFAKAGSVSVAVPVENPESGGSSYLGD